MHLFLLLLLLILTLLVSRNNGLSRNNFRHQNICSSSSSGRIVKHLPRIVHTKLAFGNGDISTAFNVATFLPQPFWLLMILLPNADITKKVIGSWLSVVTFSLVHLFIVVVSANQVDGTAPIKEFAGVFDPAGNPQLALLGMMQYPNFVSGMSTENSSPS